MVGATSVSVWSSIKQWRARNPGASLYGLNLACIVVAVVWIVGRLLLHSQKASLEGISCAEMLATSNAWRLLFWLAKNLDHVEAYDCSQTFHLALSGLLCFFASFGLSTALGVDRSIRFMFGRSADSPVTASEQKYIKYTWRCSAVVAFLAIVVPSAYKNPVLAVFIVSASLTGIPIVHAIIFSVGYCIGLAETTIGIDLILFLLTQAVLGSILSSAAPFVPFVPRS